MFDYTFKVFNPRSCLVVWPYKQRLRIFPWFFFEKMGFTPCKAEQPLEGMELQEKEVQKD